MLGVEKEYKRTRKRSRLPEASDDSFSRRELTPHRIALHFSDVEVQTTNSPQRVAHSGTEGQSLIDTPFSRDPNISVRCPPEESSQNRMGNSGFQHHSSNRSPVPSANAHNPRSVSFAIDLFAAVVFPDHLSFQNYDSTGSIRSRKHAPPPPVPFNQSQPPLTRGVDNYSSDIRSKSNVDTGSHDWEYEDKTNRSSGNVNRFVRAKLSRTIVIRRS